MKRLFVRCAPSMYSRLTSNRRMFAGSADLWIHEITVERPAASYRKAFARNLSILSGPELLVHNGHRNNGKNVAYPGVSTWW